MRETPRKEGGLLDDCGVSRITSVGTDGKFEYNCKSLKSLCSVRVNLSKRVLYTLLLSINLLILSSCSIVKLCGGVFLKY